MARGVEIVVVEGLDFGRALTVTVGPHTVLFIDPSVTSSPDYGELVYRACEWASGANRVKVQRYKTLNQLMAS